MGSSSKSKIDEKPNKNIPINYIGYVDVNSANSLFLIIDKINGCIEENNKNKCLTLLMKVKIH